MNPNVMSLLKKLLVLSLAVATAAPLCAMEGGGGGGGAGIAGDIVVAAEEEAGSGGGDGVAGRTRLAVNNALLLQAAARGDLAAVQAMIGVGADVNVQDVYGMTPLHTAAQYGNDDNIRRVVRELILHGADSTIVDGLGRTPASVAHGHGHVDTERAIKSYTFARKHHCAICTAMTVIPVVSAVLAAFCCCWGLV